MRCRQAEKPAEWKQLWIVGSWIDEDPNAQRICDVLGYEKDLCRVRFIEQRDLFEPMEALISPFLLFPYRPPADPANQ